MAKDTTPTDRKTVEQDDTQHSVANPGLMGEVPSTNGNYNDDFFFSTRKRRGSMGVPSEGNQPDVSGEVTKDKRPPPQ